MAADSAARLIYGRVVTSLRSLVRRCPALGILIVAAALLLRLALPGGFMPVVDRGQITIEICTGMPDERASMTMALFPDAEPEPMAVGDGTCAFADLSLALIGGAAPALAALSLAFAAVLALMFAQPLPRLAATRLRPPLRGPPHTA